MTGFPFLLVAIVVLRIAISASQSGDDEAGARSGPDPDPWNGTVWLPSAGLVLAALISFSRFGSVVGVGFLGLALLVVEPWFVARRVAIPLGRVRAAYWLTRASTMWFRRTRRGAAVFAAGWASVRAPERNEDAEAFVLDRVRRDEVTAGHLAALGLLAASRGDRADARLFLRAALDLFEAAPLAVVAVASEWLMAEAATRGAWDEVAEYDSRSVGADLVAAVPGARRGSGESFAAPLLFTGGRRMASWRTAASVLPDHQAPPVASSATALQRALVLHRDAWLRPAEVLAAARGWEAALAEVGPQGAGLREQVVPELVHLATVARVPAAALRFGPGSVGEEVARQRIDAAFDALGSATRALAQIRPLELDERVRELLVARELYREVVAAGGSRRVAFAGVQVAVINQAVHLYNVERQGFVARALFGWLRSEADAVGDVDTRALLDQNLTATAAWR